MNRSQRSSQEKTSGDAKSGETAIRIADRSFNANECFLGLGRRSGEPRRKSVCFGVVRPFIASGISIRQRTNSLRLWAARLDFLPPARRALTTAGIGGFRRRLWGWRPAALIIAVQVAGDVVNCVRGDLLRGGAGVIIAGAPLLFLSRPKIRATSAYNLFRRNSKGYTRRARLSKQFQNWQQ